MHAVKIHTYIIQIRLYTIQLNKIHNMKYSIQYDLKIYQFKQSFKKLQQLDLFIKKMLKIKAQKNLNYYYFANHTKIDLKTLQAIKKIAKTDKRILLDIFQINQNTSNQLQSICDLSYNKQNSKKQTQKQQQFQQINTPNRKFQQIEQKKQSNHQQVCQEQSNAQQQKQQIATISWGQLNQKTQKSSQFELVQKIEPSKGKIKKVQLQKIDEYPSAQKKHNKQYVCFACQINNQGNKKNISKCQICDGKQCIQGNNPFLKFIDEIVSQKISEILNNNNIAYENEVSVESKEQYNVKLLELPPTQIECQQNENYSWQIQFYNSGLIDWQKKKVSLHQITPKTKKLIDIKNLKAKQKYQIALIFQAQCNQNFSYRFAYLNQLNQYVYFGPTFGYQLSIAENNYKVNNIDDLRQNEIYPQFLTNSIQTQSLRARRFYQDN